MQLKKQLNNYSLKIKNAFRQYQKKLIRAARVLLPASRLRAGFTIEAALVIPVFLIFVLGISSFLILSGFRTDVQNAMQKAAEALTRRAYYLERVDMSFAGINPFTLKQEITKNLNSSEKISTAFSTYNEETGILDIIVNYDHKIPVLPGKSENLKTCQRLKCRAWIGSSMEEGFQNEEKEHENKVYVTENGTVYHRSKSCSYLDLSVHSVRPGELEELRNKSGAKYYGCPLCAGSKGPFETVYITDYGTSWHNSAGCSGLKRTIKEIDIKEAEGLRPCSKCGGNH